MNGRSDNPPEFRSPIRQLNVDNVDKPPRRRRAPDKSAAIDALVPASGDWASDFVARYELHREWRSAARQHRVSQRTDKEARPEAQPFIERAREMSDAVHARFKDGYRWFGGCVAEQPRYFRSPFVHHGLVSTQHPILRLFVASTHRAAELQTGRTKAAVTTGGPKVLSLDEAYVATNSAMRRVLRIELDSDWKSWEQLETAITAAGVQRPNIIVAHIHEVTGVVQRPHLIWMLENPVCYTERGNPANIAAFRAVLRSLCFALRDLGADPGGLSNALKTKNPLSPLWNTRIGRETPYQSLTQLRDGLPYGITKAQLYDGRQVSTDQGDNQEIAKASNGFFDTLRSWAFENVPIHHHEGLAQGSYDEFLHELTLFAYARADGFRVKEAVAKRTAAKVAEWTWRNFDGAKWQRRKVRGRDRHLTHGKTPTVARQVAGRRTAAGRAEASLAALISSYREIAAQNGSQPTQKAIQQATGISIATVKRHWRAVLAEQVSNGAIDKKAPADRRSEKPQHCSVVDTQAQSAIIQIQNPVSITKTCPPAESSQIGSEGNSAHWMAIGPSELRKAAKADFSAVDCPW